MCVNEAHIGLRWNSKDDFIGALPNRNVELCIEKAPTKVTVFTIFPIFLISTHYFYTLESDPTS